MLRPDRLVRKAIRTRYLVSTTSDEAFQGVLVDADENTLVLADVQQLGVGSEPVAVAGQLWIPRSTVKYLQTTNA